MIVPGSSFLGTGWFARLGTPLAAAELQEAGAYLSALGYEQRMAVVPVPGWRDAEAILRNTGWDPSGWDREERERARLLEAVNAHWGECETLQRLSAATEFAPDVLHRAAEIAAVRDGNADAALIRCAAGAAAMAVHQHALAQLAQCGPDHVFMRKDG